MLEVGERRVGGGFREVRTVPFSMHMHSSARADRDFPFCFSHAAAMVDRVDLTADSDDDDLQAAIRASLSSHSDSSGATSAAGNSSNSNAKRPASEQGVKETPAASHRNGKRPRSFQPFEKPPLYRLLSTSPSDRASTGSVGLDDLLSGDYESALLCNYMVDYALLVRCSPRLGSVPVTIVHGFKPGT